MPEAALAGIRVVELGERVSAPYCGKLFSDYGADVVKVEPKHGDEARRWGPFPGDVPHPEKSGLFHFLNTNKRSVTLDLGSPEGRERFLRLVAVADVLVENHLPRQWRSWGLDPAELARAHPNLVVLSITPFGRTGPYADWNATDLNAYHLSGASHRYCGRPGEAPLEHGTFAADFFGATAAAAWGLAATAGRAAAGGGQHLDVSSAEAIAATFVGGQNIGGFVQDGKAERRTGVGMPLGAPATIVPCKDGHVWMLALETGQWHGLVRVMGNPEWAQLEMFDDMFMRAQNADVIYPFIQEWSMQHDKAWIMEQCQAAGCPVTAVFTVAEAAEHPHLAARGYIVDLEHPDLGAFRGLGAPFKLPACPGGPVTAAPRLGQHTEAVQRDWAVPKQAAPARAERVATTKPPLPRAGGSALPLTGVRVANFGWVWAGPVVGQTLAFLGAEVYKVESRARVDMTRNLPPFAEGKASPDRSLSNHACWAGNGSVSLNLKRPEAVELALQLVAQSDVVIENFGPGVMNEFGLGFDALRAVKPDIVLFSMPAAGLYGPLKDIRTYGLSLTSTTGLDSITGYRGEGPTPVENAFSDPYNGIMGAYAVLTALQYRNRTGRGQHIDYSQQEAVMQMVGPAFMDYELNGRVAAPLGNLHPLGAGAPHGVFPCRGDDRWISIAVANDAEWQGLVTAMGRPGWAAAAEFADPASRLRHVDVLHAKLTDWTTAEDAASLARALQKHGVAAAPVLGVADLSSDPHYTARGTFVEVEHPLGFLETIYGAYVKTSRTEARVTPGPAIGQDNDTVFRELLGLSPARYRELVERKVIY